MGERAQEKQEAKENMVRKLVRILDDRGYGELRATYLEEFAGRRPAIVHWEGSDARFAPDIMARRKGCSHLFQVETAETLQEHAAAEKSALFATFAEHYRLQFCLVVPESCRQEGRRRLHELQADERFTRLLTLP